MGKHSRALHPYGSRVHWSKNHIVDYFLPRLLGVLGVGGDLSWLRLSLWRMEMKNDIDYARTLPEMVGTRSQRILFKKYGCCLGVGMGRGKGRCVYLFLEWSTWHDWNSNGVMAIDMQARLRLKHFSLWLRSGFGSGSACQAHKTEIESQTNRRPLCSYKIECGNGHSVTESQSRTHRPQPSQPSRPLAVAKSRSAPGNVAAVCLKWRGVGAEGGRGWFACGCICPQKGDCFKFIALSCGCNWIYSCCCCCRNMPHFVVPPATRATRR